MFSNIEEVPESIRNYYYESTTSEKLIDEGGNVVTELVIEERLNEDGEVLEVPVAVPVMVDVTRVHEKVRGETKGMSDVWRLAEKHKGSRDDLIVKFLEMVNNATSWSFHDQYLKWYLELQELEKQEVPAPTEDEPNPQELHEDRVLAHLELEPVLDSLIVVEDWLINNARALRSYAYKPSHIQNEMWFDDQINSTTTLIDHNKAVKAQYPLEKASG